MFIKTALLLALSAAAVSAQDCPPEADVNMDMYTLDNNTVLDETTLEKLETEFDKAWNTTKGGLGENTEFCDELDYPMIGENATRRMLRGLQEEEEEEDRELALKICARCKDATKWRKCLKNRYANDQNMCGVCVCINI